MSAEQPDSGDGRFRDIISDDSVLTALHVFDERRGNFYNELTEFAVSISDPEVKTVRVDLDIDSFMEPVGTLIRSILEDHDSDMDDRINLIRDIIKNDSDERVRMMCNSLDDENAVSYYNLDTLHGIIVNNIEASEDTEGIITNLTGFYCADLHNDTTEFLTMLKDVHGAQTAQAGPREGILHIKKSKGDHVMDVAKIAAGTAIALMFQRFLEKRNR